jgi:hypothetical protein
MRLRSVCDPSPVIFCCSCWITGRNEAGGKAVRNFGFGGGCHGDSHQGSSSQGSLAESVSYRENIREIFYKPLILREM